MTASDQASSDRLTGLLSSASVEVSSRGHQLQQLRDNFRPGTDVTITFLPGDNYRHNVETASALRRAGQSASRRQASPAHTVPSTRAQRQACPSPPRRPT